MTVESDVRQFIVAELAFEGSPDELTDDFPLLDSKTIDSLGVFELVTHLEASYGIEVQDEEMVPENFGTIAKIATFVASKQG